MAGFEIIRFGLYTFAFFYALSQQGITKALTTIWKIVTAPLYMARQHCARSTEQDTAPKTFTIVKYQKAGNDMEPKIKVEKSSMVVRQARRSDFDG